MTDPVITDDPCDHPTSPVQCDPRSGDPCLITTDEVRFAQQEWCKGLIEISASYPDGRYDEVAAAFINRLYDFQGGRVFFRPTLAQFPNNFRTTFEGTLAYFIGPPGKPEEGFATKTKWTSATYSNRVDTEDPAIQIYGNIAVAMGNVCLRHATSTVNTTVDKVFVYRKVRNCELKLIVHMSAARNEIGIAAIE